MVNVADIVGDLPSEADRQARLALERETRKHIKRIFHAALEDNWSVVMSLWQEALATDEWFAVAVWSGIPNTLKERIREHENQ